MRQSPRDGFASLAMTGYDSYGIAIPALIDAPIHTVVLLDVSCQIYALVAPSTWRNDLPGGYSWHAGRGDRCTEKWLCLGCYSARARNVRIFRSYSSGTA